MSNRYGALQDPFPMMRTAILHTVKETLEGMWSQDIADSWAGAFNQISEVRFTSKELCWSCPAALPLLDLRQTNCSNDTGLPDGSSAVEWQVMIMAIEEASKLRVKADEGMRGAVSLSG
jgi:hypothetical protein